MADTARTLSALQTLLADNTSGDISAQDVRDMLVSVHQEAYDVYNVRSHGAAGDGTTDDTTAINAAIGAANTADGTVYFPPGNYKITSNLTAINCDVESSASASIHVYSTATIGVTLGVNGSLRDYGTARLPRIEQKNKTWEGTTPTFGSDYGLYIVNIDGWTVDVPYITDFSEGIYINPNSGSDRVAYCTFRIGGLINNGRNLHIHPESTGWANQNTFIGGRYHVNSGEGSNIANCRHIWIEAGGSNAPNKNTFINPSVEGAGPDYNIALTGSVFYNEFFSYREEGGGGILLDSETSGDVRFNSFFGGYGVASPDINEAGTGTVRQNYFWGAETFLPPYETSVGGHPPTANKIDGMVEFNLGDKKLYIYQNSAWREIASWTA